MPKVTKNLAIHKIINMRADAKSLAGYVFKEAIVLAHLKNKIGHAA